jgi:hypothetical protein
MGGGGGDSSGCGRA